MLGTKNNCLLGRVGWPNKREEMSTLDFWWNKGQKHKHIWGDVWHGNYWAEYCFTLFLTGQHVHQEFRQYKHNTNLRPSAVLLALRCGIFGGYSSWLSRIRVQPDLVASQSHVQSVNVNKLIRKTLHLVSLKWLFTSLVVFSNHFAFNVSGKSCRCARVIQGWARSAQQDASDPLHRSFYIYFIIS